MEMQNKIDVRIFGQVYTVAGGDSADYILKIANYVDQKMKEIAQTIGVSAMPDISVLAALNIADDYYKLIAGNAADVGENKQLKADVENYQRLWEEAKTSFAQFRTEAQKTTDQLAEEEKRTEAQASEITALKEQLAEAKGANDDLAKKLEETKARLEKNESSQRDASEEMKELMEKTKELEANFFDIQMENIQLKSEVEKYKKNVIEW